MRKYRRMSTISSSCTTLHRKHEQSIPHKLEQCRSSTVLYSLRYSPYGFRRCSWETTQNPSSMIAITRSCLLSCSSIRPTKFHSKPTLNLYRCRGWMCHTRTMSGWRRRWLRSYEWLSQQSRRITYGREWRERRLSSLKPSQLPRKKVKPNHSKVLPRKTSKEENNSFSSSSKHQRPSNFSCTSILSFPSLPIT